VQAFIQLQQILIIFVVLLVNVFADTRFESDELHSPFT
jgi:hypothetical protein